MAFQKATRRKAHLKLALSGPSGSGKTMSALRLARGLTDGPIAVIDTENRSSSLYAGVSMEDARTKQPYALAFDVDDLAPPYESGTFLTAIRAAKASGYEVLIIDSFSHVWDGVLQVKQRMDDLGGNSFTNWNAAGKKFTEVVDLVRTIDIHVIVCMRSKMDYVIEVNEKGKSVPRKLGMAPVVRDGTEYEFSTMFEIDMQNQARDSKGRLKHITGGEPILLTEAVGAKLRDWLNEGEDAAPPPEVWTPELRAKANAVAGPYLANGGNPEAIKAIQARNLTPSETIAELTKLTKETTK
jgi:hypothetical protein